MSIRLRLTLLYSAILAITLIAFSTLLYVTQSQLTFDTTKSTLARQAQEFVLRERHFPRRADDNSSTATTLPGRWTQTRNVDGTVIARTFDLADTTLPLSAAGLSAVKGGTAWSETEEVQGEPLLIYSQPVEDQNRVVEIVQVAAPIAEREQSLGTLRLILLVGSILVIILAFAVGWWLSGTALSPIHRITQTARAIGAERSFSRRVQHTGPNDEIGQLTVTFNGMLTELQSAFRQVEEALLTQRRFVADASHELRTPLTTIRGNIELLRREPPIDAKERSDVLGDTKDEAERLIRLVNQLLVLARVDAGRALRRDPLPIKPLLEDSCRQTKLLDPDRTITCEAPPDAAVLADRDALKQVMLILLDNALVHTPPGASINVSSAATDGRVTISVRDTGTGIPPQLLPHIFERFYRGEVSRSGPGTGLGLAIAKELVEAQDGGLTVDSQVGQGSVFTVTLPRAEA
jgi:two-component system OmpR family sensor kinase